MTACVYKVLSVDNEGLQKEATFFNYEKAWNCFAGEVADGNNSSVELFEQEAVDKWRKIDEYRDEFSYPENLEGEN